MSDTESGKRASPAPKVITENSPFTTLFETPAAARVVDILYRHSYTSLTIGEIAERAGRDPDVIAEALRVLTASPLVAVNEDATYEAPVRDTDAADHFRWLQTHLMPATGDINRATESVHETPSLPNSP